MPQLNILKRTLSALFVSLSLSFLSVTFVSAQTASAPLSLVKGVPVTITSMAKNVSTYYTFILSASTTNFSITTKGVSGDADIYLNKDTIRTHTSSSWKSQIRGSSAETINITSPTAGTYYLEVYAFSNTATTTVTLTYNTPVAQVAQVAQVQATSSPTSNTLKSARSGYCVSAPSITNNAALTQQACTSALPITEIVNGTGSELRVTGTNYCVNIPSGKTANGTGAVLLACDSSNNQRFTILTSGTNHIYKVASAGKCLDLGTSGKIGRILQIWDCDSSLEQQFILTPVVATTTSNLLTLTKSGTGSGVITSSPSGISCGTTCSASYASGTVVTLTATPKATSTFSGWTGACTGTATTCTVTLSAAKSVGAIFTTTLTNNTLTTSVSGTGAGVITSSPAGINCGTACSLTVASGTVVTLTATPKATSTFSGWTGACSGVATCTVTLGANQSVGATFTAQVVITTNTLTLTKTGTGVGTITSSPAGINCGSTCSASFASGTVVTLTAAPSSTSTFSGWTGACSGVASCTVALGANQSVGAGFVLASSTKFTTNQRVYVNSGPLNVRDAANGNILGTQATNALGTITGGPTYTNSLWWWNVNFDTGVDGWTAEAYLTATTTAIPPVTNTLTLTKTGTGVGTITSSPAGINCGSTCSASFASGTVVTLTAAPSSTSTFSGWTGACSGVASCTVALGANQSVGAGFVANTVVPTGNILQVESSNLCIHSTVTPIVNNARVNLGPCDATAVAISETVYGSKIEMRVAGTNFCIDAATTTAVNGAPVIFWTCDNSAGQRFTPMSMSDGSRSFMTATSNKCFDTDAVAQTLQHWSCDSLAPEQRFIQLPPYGTITNVLSVSTSGTGAGTITSSPAGINCGSTCSASFASGTVVTLTPTPAAGSSFAGWTGACSGVATICLVNLSSAASVGAVFTISTVSTSTAAIIPVPPLAAVTVPTIDKFELVASDGYTEAANYANGWGGHQTRVVRNSDGSLRMLYSVYDTNGSRAWRVMKKANDTSAWTLEAQAPYVDDAYIMRDQTSDRTIVISGDRGAQGIFFSPNYARSNIPGNWVSTTGNSYAGAGIAPDGTVCIKNSLENPDTSSTNTKIECGKLNQNTLSWEWYPFIDKYIGLRHGYDYIFPGAANSTGYIATSLQQPYKDAVGLPGLTSFPYVFNGIRQYSSSYGTADNWSQTDVVPPLPFTSSTTAPETDHEDTFIDSQGRIFTSYDLFMDTQNHDASAQDGKYVVVSDSVGTILGKSKWNVPHYGKIRMFEDSAHKLWLLWVNQGSDQTQFWVYKVSQSTVNGQLVLTNDPAYTDLSAQFAQNVPVANFFISSPRGGNPVLNYIDGQFVACSATYAQGGAASISACNALGGQKIFYFRLRLP